MGQPLMEDCLKYKLLALLLLSLTLTGCIFAPDGGYGGGYRDHADHGPHGGWDNGGHRNRDQ